ncbi:MULTISPECIES: DUF6479 family protein [Streptomyces]|uniref:Secreted protein n=2 Tax=Streptomyces TaxID=1883 RepID=A0A2U9PBR4_STRAS|nr:DUF6479 family protein [Streptomyces actuosus]AWT46963.1 hypothetical protein DMT42_35045 [Streptomyces actuosus]MBM4823870.1 hypothetical protein [Streptomyces actuosus]
MNSTLYLAASAGTAFGVVAVLVAGVLITAGLIWAVRLGIGVRRREHRPPRPEEQPRLPDSGPVRESHEMRAPHEMPRTDGERLTPHELRPTGGAPSGDQQRGRWSEGSSGSFGSGGSGGA